MRKEAGKDTCLERALDDYLVSLLADLPSEEELERTVTLSPDFEARMEPLLLKARKVESRQRCTRDVKNILLAQDLNGPAFRLGLVRRKRLLAAALVIVILLSAFSVTAARERLFGFVVQVYARFSELRFGETGASESPISMGTVSTSTASAGTPATGRMPASSAEAPAGPGLLPGRIPAGYAERERLEVIGLLQIIYADETGSELIFDRHLAAGLQMAIDTEGIQPERVGIHGQDGLYYANKGLHSVIWKEGPYVYSIVGRIDKDTLTDMARSTN